MIKLHKFKACWGLPDPSPFCVKVETYLRMVALPYERVECATMFRAPKKKLPYLTDGDRIIPDSGFILDFLKATYGDTLDGRLSAEERARGHALRRMLEESLYWPMVYSRWREDRNWAVIKPLFFGGLPPVLGDLVPLFARSRVKKPCGSRAPGAMRATRSTISADRTSPPCRYSSGPCHICSAIPRPRSMRWRMDFS
ncbi:MAG: glutathione S-transferase N-terminal domain-containing protein [Pseudomonadota bacterium]|nr:glutathione S-transferase N-terminal domain-containing protein [Pseudomonadota bacterium]